MHILFFTFTRDGALQRLRAEQEPTEEATVAGDNLVAQFNAPHQRRPTQEMREAAIADQFKHPDTSSTSRKHRSLRSFEVDRFGAASGQFIGHGRPRRLLVRQRLNLIRRIVSLGPRNRAAAEAAISIPQ